MGFADDAKETAEAVGEKIERTWEDTTDRIGDKVDEMQADGKVAAAERERDATHAKNEYKENLRDS